MTRPSRLARWRAVIFRTTAVRPTVRIVMLALADYMREDGRVSVPLSTMSARLGMTHRRILAAYADAIDAELLDRVSHGYEGHTAEYQALLPGPERVPDQSTLSTPEGVLSEHPQRVSSTSTLSASKQSTLSTPERVLYPGTPIGSATHPYSATTDYAVAKNEERTDEGAGARNGRCSSCGWHVRIQGHAPACEAAA